MRGLIGTRVGMAQSLRGIDSNDPAFNASGWVMPFAVASSRQRFESPLCVAAIRSRVSPGCTRCTLCGRGVPEVGFCRPNALSGWYCVSSITTLARNGTPDEEKYVNVVDTLVTTDLNDRIAPQLNVMYGGRTLLLSSSLPGSDESTSSRCMILSVYVVTG